MDTMDAFRQLIADEVALQIKARTEATADLITGLQVSLIHVFTILIAKGIVNREAAVSSIEETLRLNRDHLPPAAAIILNHIREGIAPQAEKAPQGTAPFLRLIPGGLDEKGD